MQTAFYQLPDFQHIELCILLPCHNSLSGLITSLKSIIYDHKKFIVLIVDDGSTDRITPAALRSHLSPDINIHIVRLEKNHGITGALNIGLEYIYANFSISFIARLDCGDICDPQRFYSQLGYLHNNPTVDLVGSWCYFKNLKTGDSFRYITPTTHERIRRSMNFRNVFIHPTVMWRFSKAHLIKYPDQYPHAEDYGLFYEMIGTMKSAIIDQYLVTCEINPQGISIKNRTLQLKSRLKVITFFSKNDILSAFGALKLRVLMLIPYQFVFLVKKIIYKT